MAATITFAGTGSGIDVEGIITGLSKASRAAISPLQSRASATHSAVSTLSELSGLLSTLKTAASALDTDREVNSYSASSSQSAVVASAAGNALPGRYEIEVETLASEQRSYSRTFTSSTDALGAMGTLDIQVGSADPVSIALDANDSLETIASKINSADARVSASVFYDGTDYRLQVRGLDTGAANSISFSGSTLGLDDAVNTVQQAKDAVVYIDSFKVTRATNQIAGAIQGVTLALTETTSSPAVVSVDSDPQALGDKLKAVVTAYNAVVDRIHKVAGFGDTKAQNPVLAGDSTLRNISARLSSTVLTVFGGEASTTLSSLGVSLGRDGRLSLDDAKLSEAVAKDAVGTARVLAGTTAEDGAMDALRTLVNTLTDPNDGALATRSTGLESRAKLLDARIERENERIDRYAELLRKQFTAMDAAVAKNNVALSYLSRIG